MSGMAVHNLREMGVGMMSERQGRGPLKYSVSFDEALRDAVEGDVSTREERMAKLLKRDDARKAHPSFEHLLPVFVGAGAAGEDKGKRLWTLAEGSFSWAQFKFGEVSAA